ncbi:MAG: WYL domain-containing protein [Bradymonadaceae bacterium]
MSDDAPFAIPTIKGRIAERLEHAEDRLGDDASEMDFEDDDPERVVLETPDERGVVALACLILENLREHGGTRAPKRPLEAVAKKMLATFDRKDVMEIEIEAYEMLLWIAGAIDSDWSREEVEDVEEVGADSSNVDWIRWAIRTKTDLRMEYYTLGRGELTERRVTPISLEAETYFHAYCHMRRGDRVFRVSRIADLQPAEHPPPAEPRRRTSDDSDEDDGQMSLLED